MFQNQDSPQISRTGFVVATNMRQMADEDSNEDPRKVGVSRRYIFHRERYRVQCNTYREQLLTKCLRTGIVWLGFIGSADRWFEKNETVVRRGQFRNCGGDESRGWNRLKFQFARTGAVVRVAVVLALDSWTKGAGSGGSSLQTRRSSTVLYTFHGKKLGDWYEYGSWSCFV